MVKSVGFLAPSLTPWYPKPVPGGTAINPSLRLYSYNSTTLLDYTQYHLNLTKANEHAVTDPSVDVNTTTISVASTPKWEEFYQARKMYNLESLDAQSMAKLYHRLLSDDKLFQTYYLLNSAGYSHGRCDGHCKKGQLCAMANIRIDELNHCMDHNETSISHASSNIHHGHHYHHIINEDGMPVSGDAPASKAPYFLVILLTLGLSVMIVLTVSLCVMVTNVALRKHRLVRHEGGIQVSDLSFSLRPKGYRPF